MADRSPAPDDATFDDDATDDTARELEPVDDDADEADDEPAHDRSLTARWWWQGAVLAATGVVVIVWQWGVISSGDAIAANWAMVALGLAAVAAGGVLLWHDRPVPAATDSEPDAD
jgi:hypothetical protein